jgi:uncharacterized protein YgiM (DUF1202 family)
MKSRYVLIGALLAAVSFTAQAEVCAVTDPTGTPLNVRSVPQGYVVGKLKNGTKVTVLDYASDKNGKSWAFVANARTGIAIGWIYREFISCY